MAELPAPKLNEGIGGHWYTADGQPAYEVSKADGTGLRPTTLRDAKKLGLLPSVTTVLGILEKPQLTLWKVKNAVRCVPSVPRTEGEEEDAWIDRVLAKAAEPVAEAADFGSRIHSAIENACAGEAWDAPLLGPYVAPVLGWLVAKLAGGGRIVARETVIADAIEGYAGKVDCAISAPNGTVWVLDYKSRKTRPGETDRQAFGAYGEQKMQLSAYAAHWAVRQGLGWDKVRCANIITSSTEPGRWGIAEHDSPEESWEAFRAALALWRWDKNYDPRSGAERSKA